MVTAARSFPGELGLYVEDLSTGDRYTYNAATPFYLASVVKLVVMVAAFRQIEAGELRIDERIDLSTDDIRDGTAMADRVRVDAQVQVEELLQLMMQLSDNTATDLLLKRLGTDLVNATPTALGVNGFRPITTMLDVRRRVYAQLDPRGRQLSPGQIVRVRQNKGLRRRAAALTELWDVKPPFAARDLNEAFERYYATQVNSAPLEAVGALLARLGREQLVSPAASKAMLDLMSGCVTGRQRLRSDLPPGAVLAHKTGTQRHQACDVGIMMLPNRRVVVAMCAKEFGELVSAERLMARIGRRIYELLDAAPEPESEPEPDIAVPPAPAPDKVTPLPTRPPAQIPAESPSPMPKPGEPDLGTCQPEAEAPPGAPGRARVHVAGRDLELVAGTELHGPFEIPIARQGLDIEQRLAARTAGFVHNEGGATSTVAAGASIAAEDLHDALGRRDPLPAKGTADLDCLLGRCELGGSPGLVEQLAHVVSLHLWLGLPTTAAATGLWPSRRPRYQRDARVSVADSR
jgi:beta-lactamase class A